ncbi:PREDICTED: coiled-coil domain-containing protein 189 isoform X15 [Hipposideros armiger]|uniref:Coiled-coil domain-containing protein 189 isoform X15 n=1 Tax=Hipposideros armiger TaxID=186990 RepID=A0A8B7Q5W0_HIPAR|nr:PREDICTED: coiled-coil domain-containing protein 189 isoform X15 [Hipposideros armiger]
MIRQKSSLFQGLRMQSELVQPSELWREPEDLSSVEESATLVGTGVRTELGTTASVGADEDPAVNLFPPPLPRPRICMWKYLDIHSMHRLEKTANTEDLMEVSHRSRCQRPVPCSRISTRPVLQPPWAMWRNATATSPVFFFAMESGCPPQPLSSSSQVRLDLSLTYVGLQLPQLSLEETEKEGSKEAEERAVTQQEEEPETAEEPEQEPSQVAILCTYIKSQLNKELVQLQQLVEERLQASEERLSSKLTALEQLFQPPPGKGKSKAK